MPRNVLDWQVGDCTGVRFSENKRGAYIVRKHTYQARVVCHGPVCQARVPCRSLVVVVVVVVVMVVVARMANSLRKNSVFECHGFAILAHSLFFLVFLGFLGTL